ncbi:MAG: DUF2889 domain-containing protein [Rubrivivax sp.]|nr:DUF2889 domain-containing protein [Rubrivivax sp.]
MPLPPPDCARKAWHQRSINIRSYVRTDGLWDVEGHLTDEWFDPAPKADGVLQPGEPMHSMRLRFTVDRTATIVAVQCVTEAGPYDAACGTIAPDYGKLVGVQVSRGYRDAIRSLLGRTAGCTHITELAGALGTVVLQAIWTEVAVDPEQRSFALVDGCHALESSGPQVMKYFPRWYRPKTEGA